MRNMFIVGVVLMSGCMRDPYPILDDTNLGMGGSQPIPGSVQGQAVGMPNFGQSIDSKPQMQQQKPQLPTTTPPTPMVSVSKTDIAAYPQKVQIPSVETMRIITDKGEIVIELFPADAPQTVQNYITKARDNFYNQLIFHRVEDWVIQGGDPNGDGTGGGTMPTELSARAFGVGSVGVARGRDKEISNDAQFFICISDCSWLTGEYTIFGQVTEGIEVASSIEVGDTIRSVSIE